MFLTLARAGVKDQGWDSDRWCLCIISLSAGPPGRQTACLKICFARNIVRKSSEKAGQKVCLISCNVGSPQFQTKSDDTWKKKLGICLRATFTPDGEIATETQPLEVLNIQVRIY